MIYKLAAVGFALFVAAVCYTCSVVASMADDEYEEMTRDLWIDKQNQNGQTGSEDTHDASVNQK